MKNIADIMKKENATEDVKKAYKNPVEVVQWIEE